MKRINKIITSAIVLACTQTDSAGFFSKLLCCCENVNHTELRRQELTIDKVWYSLNMFEEVRKESTTDGVCLDTSEIQTTDDISQLQDKTHFVFKKTLSPDEHVQFVKNVLNQLKPVYKETYEMAQKACNGPQYNRLFVRPWVENDLVNRCARNDTKCTYFTRTDYFISLVCLTRSENILVPKHRNQITPGMLAVILVDQELTIFFPVKDDESTMTAI